MKTCREVCDRCCDSTVSGWFADNKIFEAFNKVKQRNWNDHVCICPCIPSNPDVIQYPPPGCIYIAEITLIKEVEPNYKYPRVTYSIGGFTQKKRRGSDDFAQTLLCMSFAFGTSYYASSQSWAYEFYVLFFGAALLSVLFMVRGSKKLIDKATGTGGK